MADLTNPIGAVLEVFEDGKPTEYFGILGDDVWRVERGDVDEDHGFTRGSLHRDEFKRLIAARSKRLRYNALTGKYQYTD